MEGANKGLRLNENSRPERQIPGVLSRATDLFIQLRLARLDRGGNGLGNAGALALRQVKTLAERLICHSLAHDPFQAAMLVTGTDAVAAVHFLEVSRAKDHND